MTFNPLEHPVCLEFPLWQPETAWAEHIPFAMYLISAMQPQVLVELGAFRGASYCAFCQAVKSVRTQTKCYAVDTWQGDEHAGNLETGVLETLRAHHDPLYADFSSLIRSTFDDAVQHFDDKSIDLLHIDGFHTYEAVKHDFETWLPKMSENAVVIFHDTNVRERDFGVWRFWDELRKDYRQFEFLHGHGLGVLAVGTKTSENLDFLFTADEIETKLIREFFYQLGARTGSILQSHEQKKEIENLRNYIETLQTYEKVVRGSKTMRAARILQTEGVVNLVKKGFGKFGKKK
jgi:O-antigen biosynthesis protein